MCLTEVTKITNRKRKGWKVFCSGSMGIRSLHYAKASGFHTIPQDVWIRDRHAGKGIFTQFAFPNYPTGFHVYLDKKHAEKVADLHSNRVVKRIRFRKVVAQGLQRYGPIMAPTIVAEEMYVESGKEKKDV